MRAVRPWSLVATTQMKNTSRYNYTLWPPPQLGGGAYFLSSSFFLSFLPQLDSLCTSLLSFSLFLLCPFSAACVFLPASYPVNSLPTPRALPLVLSPSAPPGPPLPVPSPWSLFLPAGGYIRAWHQLVSLVLISFFFSFLYKIWTKIDDPGGAKSPPSRRVWNKPKSNEQLNQRKD